MFGLRLARNSSDTARVEAFSDGVLAIAITLLVLEIHVDPGAGNLATALREAWPQYVAYATGFLTILVLWANHHDLFKIIATCDRGLQFFNGLLLLTIGFLPFPTAILAEHMNGPADDRQAALLAYGATMVAVAFGYNGVWRYARSRGLLIDTMSSEAITEIDRAYFFAPFIYGAAMLLSFFSAWVSILVWIGFALFWQFFSYSPEPAVAHNDGPTLS